MSVNSKDASYRDISFSSENNLQEYLEEQFEANGWLALREVSPHHSDYRADLIVKHDRFGWFGIETKILGNGRTLAEAHHQILTKYYGKKYVNSPPITRWVISPHISSDHSQRARYTRKFVREFFCRHGVGYLNPAAKTHTMDFAYSRAGLQVPIDDSHNYYMDRLDLEAIDESIEKKRDKFSYGGEV